jgi:hypothetical protein
MARAPSKRFGGGGLNIGIDTSELVDFSQRVSQATRVTKPVIAAGLNDVGDELVATIATSLSKQTGLGLEVVRGLMTVKPAKRSDLAYEVRVDPRLFERGAGRTLEGQRESTEFGRNRPDELVIVKSKGDELVCMDCEELAAAGPMPAAVAMQHVPKHPNCRCIILPYVTKGKRLEVTMTSVSGTDPTRRVGGKKAIVEADRTIRQLAQTMMDKATRVIRIELK